MSEQRAVTVYRWEADRPRCDHVTRVGVPDVIQPHSGEFWCDLPSGHAGGHVSTAFGPNGHTARVEDPTPDEHR